jgi:signal transduction histidine kinase
VLAGHNDDVPERVRRLLTAVRRAEPRGPAPTAWALALDAAVALVAAGGAVWEVAHRVVVKAVLPPGTRTRPVYVYPGAQFHVNGGPVTAIFVHAPIAVVVAAALTALPLAFRRYYPISVWLVIAFAIVMLRAVGVPPVALGTAVYGAYSAIVHSRYRSVAIAAVTIVTLVVALVLGRDLPSIPGQLTAVFTILLAAAAGSGIRKLRGRLADSAANLRRAAAEARAATEAALAAERSRIAAELHDVVTHNVSVMIVQAGAARKILSSSPADAQDALLAVEATGREAMTELRNLLGLLSPRADGGNEAVGAGHAGGNGSAGAGGLGAVASAAAFSPQPGLSELDTLIGRVSAAGVLVEPRITGEPWPLPPGANLTAYRLVQEGLTNVLRHAPQATATVAIDWGKDLVITVTDDGGLEPAHATRGDGARGSDGPPGRGLLGLRERLALYGGTLAAGPQPGGGWQLRAVMPVPERSTP